MAISANYASSYTGSTLMADGQTHQPKSKLIQQEFESLSSDLSSGNLSGAQSVFAQIEQNLPTPPTSSASSSSSASSTGSATTTQSTIQKDMSTLGQALSSGNLSAAQAAYTQLQNDLPTPPAGSVDGSNTDSLQASGQNEFTSAISSLSDSLSSNNLSGAQSAFNQLEQLFQHQSNGNSATNAYSQNAGALLSVLGLNSSSSLQVAA